MRFTLGLTVLLYGCVVFLLQQGSAKAQPSEGVFRQIYENIGGTNVADLIADPDYPGNPSLETIEPAFESPVNFRDYYGQRLRALVLPPETGAYQFWIASSHNGILFLSTTESPAQKTQIAAVNGWTAVRQWDKEPNQQSVPIQLQAGQRYYLEALTKNELGADNLSVRWRLPGGVIEEPIPALRLIPFGLGAPVITRPPTNSTVVEGESVIFSIEVERELGSVFQWMKDGVNIAGATNTVYTHARVPVSDDGSGFRCRVATLDGAVLSGEALLTVTPDISPPLILNAGNGGDATSLFIVFSEPVSESSITNLSNYLLSGGVTVTGAALGVDDRTVILRTTPMVAGESYTVMVSGVEDGAAVPNVILPGSASLFERVSIPLELGFLSPPREPLGPSSRRHGIVISEVMYHPAPRQDGRELEFIEIYNSQPWLEELGGWRVTGAAEYLFPSNTVIQAGGFHVLAVHPQDLEAVYGIGGVGGPIVAPEGLPDDSGVLQLWNGAGGLVFEMEYRDRAPYPAAADGGGPSLELARPSYGESDPRAWDVSESAGGSPGSRAMQMPLITTLALPMDGGLVSGGGGYVEGAEAAVMATPHPGFLFVNWTENGVEVSASPAYGFTISSDRLLVANFRPAAQNTNFQRFVISQALGNLRNDFSGFLGMQITVGASPIQVAALGRYVSGNNSGSHDLKIVRRSDSADVPGSLVTVFASGGVEGTMQYGYLPAAVTLQANTSYYVVSREVMGGDVWHDFLGTVVTTAGFASADGPVFFLGSWTIPAGQFNRAFVPVDFLVTQSGVPASLPVGAVAFPPEGGGASGSGNYAPGAAALLTAMAAPGFAFVSWTENGTVVSESEEYSFPVSGPRALVANFRPAGVGVMINEFLAHSDLPEVDFIELHNYGTALLDLSGYVLTDDVGTNKFRIPPGTFLAGGGFVVFGEGELGFGLSAGGERILLRKPDGVSVVDAVRFGAQGGGVSSGRYPDGAPGFSPLSDPTPGMANSPLLLPPVVINEILFDPVTADAGDEFVELHNWTGGPVDVGGWRLRDGITFEIPSGTVMPAGGYLVIGSDAARLRLDHPGLNAQNTLGDFGGRLANGGERIELDRPEELVATNQFGQLETNLVHVTVDEVSYGAGGRWGDWVGGGGSSLELRDVRSDRRRAPNWGGSDESGKSGWTLVEATGVIDHTISDGYQLHVTLRGAGEVLIDDVEVFLAGGGNLVANGGFESGSGGWVAQGSHRATGWDSEGYQGSGSLRIRATGRGDTGSNRVRTRLPFSLLSGEVTIRARVRWLKGNPNVLLRLRGNGMEAFGYTLTARNLGTPGAPNSVAAANVGPAITEVRHHPLLPDGAEPVRVTAHVHDPDGLALVTVRYRLDLFTNYNTLVMTNHGAGVFSALLPAQPAGGTVGFMVEATDHAAAPLTRRFPAGAPEQECVVRWGDTAVPGALGIYRMWLTRTNHSRWSEEETMSNNPKDVTFIYGTNRVIYNAGGVFHGGPFHSGNYDSPTGVSCDYDLLMPPDDRLLGETGIYLFRPGNNGQDGTGQKEIHGNWFASQFGLPFLYHRPVFVHVNGQQRGLIFHDAQQPDGNYVEAWFSEEPEGVLHKVAGGFEFGDEANGVSEPGFAVVGSDLAPYLTAGGEKKLARYRLTWPLRSAPPPLENDYSELLALVDAVNTTAPLGSDAYTTTLRNATDVERWFQVHATQHLYSNTDSFSYGGGANAFVYRPPASPWQLLLWDIDFAFAGTPSTPDLFFIGGAEHGPRVDHPEFERIYWQALLEAANGMMTPERSDAMIDARENGLLSAGAAVGSGMEIKQFIAARRALILSQAAFSQTNFAILSNGGSDFVTNVNLITLQGTAPLEVRDVLVNGVRYPVTWTSRAVWNLRVPLAAATNTLVVSGVDRHGNPLAGVSGTIRVVSTGGGESPVGKVVINEIMYQPPDPDASFVELHNASTLQGFDLRGWYLEGVSFTFGAGALIEPGGFVVLVRDRAAFMAAHGAGIPVAGEFSGRLSNEGETLRLLMPSLTPGQGVLVDEVTYDDEAPWAAEAAGQGSSLQLIDPLIDNQRVANWVAVGTNDLELRATPGRVNAVVLALPEFPLVWLNEVQPENVFTGGVVPLDRFGEADPWVELYNGGTNAIDLGGYRLSPGYILPGQWSFPPNTLIPAGEFLLVWLDGEPGETGGGELHANFRPPAARGSVVLIDPSLTVVDYLNYEAPVPGRSYGSHPDGVVAGRRLFFFVTAGQPNDPGFAPVDVRINEWMADNATGVVDPADGVHEDWFELFNAGVVAADLGGYFVSDDPGDPGKWSIPLGTVIPPRSYLMIWADGDTDQNGGPELHAGFSLARGGESIGLFTPAGAVIDSVTFGVQIEDVSSGRYPDGTFPIFLMTNSTPGSANTLSAANGAPIVVGVQDRTVEEWDLLEVMVFANDPDTLVFDLDPGAPMGMFIDPATGLIEWTPVEAQGPGVHEVTVRVTDDGEPPLSSTMLFVVTVTERNSAPDLVFDPVRAVTSHSLVNFFVTGIDQDLPAQALTYTLEPGAPAGVYLDPSTGEFLWLPTLADRGTNQMTLRVTDGGVPAMTRTRALTVVVDPTLAVLISRLGTRVRLTFETTPGRIYRVDYKNSLAETEWTASAAEILASSTSMTILYMTGVSEQRFYRVVELE